MANPSAPENDSLLSGIRRHLDGLKGTRDGQVLYSLIERGLKRYDETGHIERAFVNFVTSLLGRYAKDPAYDASTRIKARLIQQRLTLHLAGATAAPTSAPMAQPVAPPKAPPPTPDAIAPPSPTVAPAPKPEPPIPARTPPPPPTVVEKSTPEVPIQVLEQELVEQVAHTFEVEGALATPDVTNTLTEFSDLKDILIKGLDELIRERNALIRRVEGATGYLKAIENDRRRLKEELGKARKHSSVDELTGLPKRDIFIRSLEAEVGRVRRYGFSFALALIDVDGLGAINEQYGREAGDAVLRCYGSEILARFRTYDLVSRYGDDEFAVLFPNTQKDGALRALEKAQKNAVSTYVTHEGRSIRVPTFSSVLTVYAQGEKSAQLLQRAAEALDHARLHGNNQIFVSLPSA